jgi:hypothetical protein
MRGHHAAVTVKIGMARWTRKLSLARQSGHLLRHIYVVRHRERSLSVASSAMLELIVRDLGRLQ